MSLLRLLTAGRSLIGLKESVNRYRVDQRALLPKFDAAPNPFRKTVLPAGSPPLHTVASPSAQSPEAADSEASAASRSASPGMAGRLAAKIKGLVTTAPRRKQAVQTKAVQVELALESVQVVRNDLSESDIEVVVANQGAAMTAKGSVETGPETSGWKVRGLSLLRRAAPGREPVKS